MIRTTISPRAFRKSSPLNSLGLLTGAAALLLSIPANAQSDQHPNAPMNFSGFSVSATPRPQATDPNGATQSDKQGLDAARRRGQAGQSSSLTLGSRASGHVNIGDAANPHLPIFYRGGGGEILGNGPNTVGVHLYATSTPAGGYSNSDYRNQPADPDSRNQIPTPAGFFPPGTPQYPAGFYPLSTNRHHDGSTQYIGSGSNYGGDGNTYIYPNATYVYPNGGTVIVTGGVTFLGGYYYGNYCNTPYGSQSYPSVYSIYNGFPQYICSNSVYIAPDPYTPTYDAPPSDFYAPDYPVTYQDTSYYVTSEQRAADVDAGGQRARRAINSAYPSDSYQAAFGDIERAWNDGKLSLLRSHLRDNDTKISVSLDGKYAYSIASSDFSTITRDALDRLDTASFKFTELQKSENGDVTAYGRHVYRAISDSKGGTDVGKTVPFDSSSPDNTTEKSAGSQHTVYVSYTLHQRGGQWYIIAVSSSAKDNLN